MRTTAELCSGSFKNTEEDSLNQVGEICSLAYACSQATPQDYRSSDPETEN